MSAPPRLIRRLAFQTLFQLDARGEVDAAYVRESLENAEGFEPRDREKAFELAWGAYQNRKRADEEMLRLAPTWPAHRQAAVDRSILRLAHFELSLLKVSPKVVVSEAVELAKEFSTDKSPAFVNGLLDKVLKRLWPEWEKKQAAQQPGGEARAE